MAEWVWRCGCMGIVIRRRARVCPFCGESPMEGGWEYELNEAMAVYQYVTGLKPIGEHRAMADECLNGLRVSCERCGGRGLLTLPASRYSACPDCEGTGGFWKPPLEEVEAVLARIVERYPDAALAETPGNFRAGALSFDERRGAVVARRHARRVRAGESAAGTSPAPAVAEPSAFERPKQRAPRRRRSRQTGVSCDGLRFADVTEAFRLAELLLGTDWRVKGRNHCDRVTLHSRYVKHAAAGATSWERFYPRGSMNQLTIFPRAVVLEAAHLLGVRPEVLIGKAW